jgi:hypothetical protein
MFVFHFHNLEFVVFATRCVLHVPDCIKAYHAVTVLWLGIRPFVEQSPWEIVTTWRDQDHPFPLKIARSRARPRAEWARRRYGRRDPGRGQARRGHEGRCSRQSFSIRWIDGAFGCRFIDDSFVLFSSFSDCFRWSGTVCAHFTHVVV